MIAALRAVLVASAIALAGCGSDEGATDVPPVTVVDDDGAAAGVTFRGTVQMVVLSGADPAANDLVATTLAVVAGSENFRHELGLDTGIEAAQISLVACRPAASAILEVIVEHPDRSVVERLVGSIEPTLRRVARSGLQHVPPELQLAEPIVSTLVRPPIAEAAEGDAPGCDPSAGSGTVTTASGGGG